MATALPLALPFFVDNHVLFIGKKNRRQRIFVPSAENNIGGIPYEDVMFDSGCNSILLFLHGSEDVEFLSTEYPLSQYSWEFTNGRSVGSRTYVLKIAAHSGQNVFSLRLGDDLGSRMLMIPRLRFHLCQDDLIYFSKALQAKKLNGARGRIRQAIMVGGDIIRDGVVNAPPMRRTHCLIGQDVMRMCITIDTLDMFFVLEPNQPITAALIAAIADRPPPMEQLFVASAITQSGNFDDLEDEDHNADAPFEQPGEDEGTDEE